MATLDLSQATQSFHMTDGNAVGFDTWTVQSASEWRFGTTGGHQVSVIGQGFTFDAAGRALTGTATAIEIDLGTNNFNNPDIMISGINVPAAGLDDGPASFWRLLEGNDTIVLPAVTPDTVASGFRIFGDGVAERTGTVAGGDDVIATGDAVSYVAGDAERVGSQTAGTPSTVYRGGADDIRGGVTAKQQFVSGDVAYVDATGRLDGGADYIFMQSSNAGSMAIGDAEIVTGLAGNRAEVFAGNDTIVAGAMSRATLIGDVWRAQVNGFVDGGDDTIVGGIIKEDIVGDVHDLRGSQLIGGKDTILGGDGADQIFGDVMTADFASRVTGGDDVIHGGANDDYIYGEGLGPGVFIGGNDRLHGDSGRDTMFGQSGNDTLNGGADGDFLYGGDGFDTASYAGAGQRVRMSLDGSFTAEGDALGDSLQGIEALEGTDFGDALGGDNNFNRLIGGGGGDSLMGRGGSDVLIGGIGSDSLTGGLGNDSFDFTALNQGGDKIYDYSNVSGNNDTLRFEGDVFGGLPNGTIAAKHFVANADGLATTADHRFVYETDTGVLRYDANGSAAGGVTLIATLTGAPTLTFTDFSII